MIANFKRSCSLSLSEEPGFPKFFANMDKYFSKITLRPLSISNAPEPIRRPGCIAMNTPVEIDIYAHANSTLVGGTRMITVSAARATSCATAT